ncbi:MAG: tetratricopeptide repeat protein [Pirellulaceae bacterium]
MTGWLQRTSHSDTPSSPDFNVNKSPPISPETVFDISSSPPKTTEAIRDEAFDLCKTLIADSPTSPEAIAVLALSQMRWGQTDEASESWRRALALNPQFSPAHVGLGRIAHTAGQPQSVVKHMQAAIAANSKQCAAYAPLIDALLQLPDIDQAFQVAEAYQRLCPEDNEAYFWLGQVYLQREEYDRARAAHENSIRLNPQATRSYYSLALACQRLGDDQQAAAYRKTFLELSRQDLDRQRQANREHEDVSYVRGWASGVWFSAGEVYRKNGQGLKAEACWVRGARLDTGEVACREGLVALYREERRFPAAVQVLEELVASHHERADYWTSLGESRMEMRQATEASSAFRSALRIDPRFLAAYLGLAQLELQIPGSVPDAAVMAEKAADIQPSPETFVTLGALLQQQGRPRDAVDAMRKAIELAPNNSQLRATYEQMLQEAE